VSAVQGSRTVFGAKIAMVEDLLEQCQTVEKTRQIVEHLPGCLEAVNYFAQTALHVACLRGAQQDVISYICLQFPMTCSITDQYGKLPLHYLVTYSKRFLEDVKTSNQWYGDLFAENEQDCTIKCRTEDYLAMLSTVIKQ
jgi:hypothetical protein